MTAMRSSALTLLVVALSACGDDEAGLTDTGSGTDPSTTATATAGGSITTDGADTTEGTDGSGGDDMVDPTPILEREPLTTHTCEETRAMTQAAGAEFGRSDALVTVGGEYIVLRSADTLTLANIALDGTIGDEAVLEAEAFAFQGATAIATDAGIATVWTYNDGMGSVLRYAAVDDTLGTVVAPKDVPGLAAAYVTAAAMVPAASGGVALLYGESDAGGQTRLRFVELGPDGEASTTPLDVAEVGQTYGAISASAAPTSDGGYAVAYVVGEVLETEVRFVILDADGTPRFEPERLSRAAGGGWRSEFGFVARRNLLPVGDRFWVAFTEGWFNPDSMQMEGNVVVRLAIVDAQGHSEGHLLQAPVDGKNNLSPSFVELDDRVGLLWTSGTIIWICGGCIADNDLHFVLLDPDAVVPASNVATELHQTNGIVAPLGAFVGADMLTAASLDFHAVTLPASGALRCEPTG
jgi:hypothetical protein